MSMIQGFLAWLVIGALAGWLAYLIAQQEPTAQADIIGGIVGACLSGMLFQAVTNGASFHIWSVFVAFVGAAVLLALKRAFSPTRLERDWLGYKTADDINRSALPKTQHEVIALYYQEAIWAAQCYEKFLRNVLDHANKDIAATWNNPHIEPPRIEENTKEVMDEITRVHHFMASMFRAYDAHIVGTSDREIPNEF